MRHTIVLIVAILTGCASTSILPGNDPIIVRVQQFRQVAFAVTDAFVNLEKGNRDLLWKSNHGFKLTADNVRRTAPLMFKTLDVALETYKIKRDPESARLLVSAMDALKPVVIDTQNNFLKASSIADINVK